MKRLVLCLLLLLASSLFTRAFANAVVVSNVERVGASQVRFSVSWENSWRVGGAPGNHDAVWVFVKFRRCDSNDPQFSHALLSTTMADHT
ncbi:MAG: hypothetical protein ACK5QE_02450, partial [Sphingobacteriia bacterium]